MKYITKKTLLVFLIIFLSSNLDAQILDTLPQNILDSNLNYNVTNDSLTVDTLFTIKDSKFNIKDTIPLVPKKNNSISEKIDFSAKDSMYISVKNKQIVLFGSGTLNTVEMDLIADSIGLNMSKKELMASGLKDSTGSVSGIPAFKTDGKDYTANRMRYNFETKNGLVYDVITAEQDGFLHGEVVKIHCNGEIHIKNGKYTTCNHPHPHYYIALSKAKLKSKDKIITKSLYFVIQDIPMPIYAPFGFFPLSRKNTSGIHLPSYADELDRGFGLVGGGYFWAVNDYLDLDFTGDVYSKGSWGVNVKTNLKKRYLYTAKVDLSFFHYQNGEKILKTTVINNSYKVNVSYNQDQKALPYSNLSANINYVYGNIQQYNATDIDNFVKTTANSSVSYQKTFNGTPFRMNATMNMSQNLSDSTVNVKFPSMTFSMNKVFLFKPKNKPAKGKWYEKIGISFSSSLVNSVDTHDTILFKHFDITKKLMKSGFKYNVPLQTNLTLFKFINITPSFNFNGRIYPYKIERNIEGLPDTAYISSDTIWGFNHLSEYNTRINFNTRIYGTFNINIGSLKAIRHTIAPSISYIYKPDFSDEKFGYYEEDPLDSTDIYSFYSNGVYGVPGKGEQQLLTFSVTNNFEAKVLQGKDTSRVEKKIKLLDNLNFSSGYNFAADSLKFRNISMSASMSPVKNTRLAFTAIFDPYVINSDGIRINKFELLENNKLARLTQSNLTIGTKIKSSDFKNNGNSNNNNNNNVNDNGNDNLLNDNTNKINNNGNTEDGLSWSADIDYSFRFSKTYNVNDSEFDINLKQILSLRFSLSPTPLWSLGIRSGYDFDAGKITSTTLDLYRDLHCWEMSLRVTPFGRMKSYMFNIKIKASMFDAIKFKKERSWHDNF